MTTLVAGPLPEEGEPLVEAPRAPDAPSAEPLPGEAPADRSTKAEKAIATPRAIAADTRKQRMRGNRSLAILATVAVILLLYFGGPFFIPLMVALLISFALTPLVDALTKVVRFRAISAGVVVIAALGSMGWAAYAWSDDALAIWEKVPDAAKSISRSLQKIAQKPSPITDVKKAAADIETAAQGGRPAPAAAPAAPTPSTASQISMWQLVWTGGKGVAIAAGQLVVVSFLVFFMLASGTLFKKKIVLMSGERLAQRKLTVEVLDKIDLQIRRYLLVMLASNVLVGLGTWIVFSIAGVEFAGLWGLVAAVLHTVPYFGSALVAVGSLVVAFVQFEDWSQAFTVAGSSVVVATLVGNIFSTWLASRQTRINTTAAFVGLLFFGWIWGLWGLLLGIPIVAIVKTVCDHNEDWKMFAELLGE
ncbi:MAG TPA: AI-2E family transporter [Usitatibacter sp.]